MQRRLPKLLDRKRVIEAELGRVENRRVALHAEMAELIPVIDAMLDALRQDIRGYDGATSEG